MPMSMSTSDMIRIKRLESKVTEPTTLSNFSPYSNIIPTDTPANNASSTVFVISCIDPRFTYAVEEYLLSQLGPSTTYDLFVLAGSAMGGRLTGNGTPIPSCSLVSVSNNWREVLFDHLQVAITLHNVSKIYIIDHAGCAAYGVCGATDTINGHRNNFNVLRNAIATVSPATTFYANGTSNPSSKVAGEDIFGVSGANITGLYFNTPVGLTTDLYDYTSGAPALVGTYTYPQTSGAKVLVLGCIDPRFSEILSSFLINYKQVQFNYDLFIMAGSSLGVNQSYNLNGTQRTNGQTGDVYTNNLLAVAGSLKIGPLGHNWGPTFFDHLSVAVQVHRITEVWVFDHLDCGAYKFIKLASGGVPAATDSNPLPHISEIQKLQASINLVQPTLAFKGFIMDTAGLITKVVDDTRGIELDNISYPSTIGTFGSSRIRAPASEIIDLRAKASADFVLVREHTGNLTPGFGRELVRTKLTPVHALGVSQSEGSQTGVLETKVGPLKSALLNRNRL